jgi:hypothetical protein
VNHEDWMAELEDVATAGTDELAALLDDLHDEEPPT